MTALATFAQCLTIKTGDRVVITKGHYMGLEATVRAVGSGMATLDVDAMTRPIYKPVTELQKVEGWRHA